MLISGALKAKTRKLLLRGEVTLPIITEHKGEKESYGPGCLLERIGLCRRSLPWIFVVFVLNLWISWRRVDALTMLSFPAHEHSAPLHLVELGPL